MLCQLPINSKILYQENCQAGRRKSEHYQNHTFFIYIIPFLKSLKKSLFLFLSRTVLSLPIFQEHVGNEILMLHYSIELIQGRPKLLFLCYLRFFYLTLHNRILHSVFCLTPKTFLNMVFPCHRALFIYSLPSISLISIYSFNESILQLPQIVVDDLYTRDTL